MYMKKIIYMAFAAMGLMTLASCSDSDYDEKYANPFRRCLQAFFRPATPG